MPFWQTLRENSVLQSAVPHEAWHACLLPLLTQQLSRRCLVLSDAACRSISLPVGSNSLQMPGTMQNPAVLAQLSCGAPAAAFSLDQLSGRKRSLGTGSANGKRIRTANPPASPQQQLRRQWEQEAMVDLGLGVHPVELMGSSTLRSSGALSVQPQPQSPQMGDAGSMNLQALSAPHLLLQQQQALLPQQQQALLPMQQGVLLPHLRAQQRAGSTDSEQPSCTSAAGPGAALVSRPSQQMNHTTSPETFACEVPAPLLMAGAAEGQQGSSLAGERSAGSGDLMLDLEGHGAASRRPAPAAAGCLGQQAEQQHPQGALLDPLGIGPGSGAQLNWASTRCNSGMDTNEHGSPALDFTQQLQQQQRMVPQAVPLSLPLDSDDGMASIEAISMSIVQAPTAFGKPTNAHKVFAPPFTVRAHACSCGCAACRRMCWAAICVHWEPLLGSARGSVAASLAQLVHHR